MAYPALKDKDRVNLEEGVLSFDEISSPLSSISFTHTTISASDTPDAMYSAKMTFLPTFPFIIFANSTAATESRPGERLLRMETENQRKQKQKVMKSKIQSNFQSQMSRQGQMRW